GLKHGACLEPERLWYKIAGWFWIRCALLEVKNPSRGGRNCPRRQGAGRWHGVIARSSSDSPHGRKRSTLVLASHRESLYSAACAWSEPSSASFSSLPPA